MKLNIRADISAASRYLRALPQALRDKAAARAMNRAVETGRTAMGRQIRAEFNLPAAFVRDSLRIERASARGGQLRLEASVGAKGKRSTNLIRFIERSVTLAEARRRRKSGTLNRVYVRIKRSGGRVALPPGSFVATSKGGTAVFQRVGKSRTPIKALATISVPSMFNTERINRVIRKRLVEEFLKRYEHEARQVLRGV